MFTFFSVWVLAVQIPYTAFVATRRAKVDAFLDGVQLPAETVQAALAAAGESDKYSSLHPGTPFVILGPFSGTVYELLPQSSFLPFSLGLPWSSLPPL